MDGVKILTFTSEVIHDTNAPSAEYIEVITEGLKEAYTDMSFKQINQYLKY